MQILDDNPIVISWSEVSAYRQCPFKHHLAYRERWQSEDDKEVLARGTAWHEILEHVYQSLADHGEITDETADRIADLLGWNQVEMTERQQLLTWMYEGYLRQWVKEDPKWQIKAVEWKGFAPLPHPDGPDHPSRFMLKVKIDLLATLRGRLWVWDHKSARNLPSEKELDLDDQFGLYIWCLRQLGYPVAGAVYNCARTQRNVSKPQPLDERFSRTHLTRTDIELDTIAREAYMSAERAWPETPSIRIPERNTDTDLCKWKCDYTEACLSSRKGGRLEDMLRAHGYSPRPFRAVEVEWKEHKGQ